MSKNREKIIKNMEKPSKSRKNRKDCQNVE